MRSFVKSHRLSLCTHRPKFEIHPKVSISNRRKNSPNENIVAELAGVTLTDLRPIFFRGSATADHFSARAGAGAPGGSGSKARSRARKCDLANRTYRLPPPQDILRHCFPSAVPILKGCYFARRTTWAPEDRPITS
jgi:hypothetical protein